MKQPSFQEALSFLLEAVSGTPNLPLRAFDDVFPELASLGQCYLNISDVSPSHLNGRYRVIDWGEPHRLDQKSLKLSFSV